MRTSSQCDGVAAATWERTLIHEEVANISLAGVYAILVVLFFASATFGSWLGRRIYTRGGDDKDATTLATPQWVFWRC